MEAAAPRSQRVGYPLHLTRAILRSISTFFLFLAFCLFIADGASCVRVVNGFNTSIGDGFYEDPAQNCWYDPLFGDVRPIVIIIIAVIWNVVEFITLCINRRGIHPGAHVGIDLILSWALFSVAGVSFWIISTALNNDYLGKYIAASVFTILAALVQFVLFILDAIAVHKWRRSRPGYGYGHNSYYGGQPPIIYQQPAAQPIVYQQPGGQYTSLPPPPPGMAYLVPMPGAGGQTDVQMMPIPRAAGDESVAPVGEAAAAKQVERY